LTALAGRGVVGAMSGDARTVTALLREWRSGDPAALEELTPLVYAELYKLAASYMRSERSGHTLRPTDLVGEAYVRLAAGASPDVTNRVHFFGIAARVMRQILVDHARKHNAEKRGGGEAPELLDEGAIAVERPAALVALDDSLEALAKLDERKARAVELHYFGGLTHIEIAELLGVHANTVNRDLQFAVAWIRQQLGPAA